VPGGKKGGKPKEKRRTKRGIGVHRGEALRERWARGAGRRDKEDPGKKILFFGGAGKDKVVRGGEL